MHKALGAVHIHSTYSDGSENIETIAKIAKKAGLDWIVITDHNTMDGYLDNKEGWYDGVAVLIGEEISPDLSDHYLGLGINSFISEHTTPEEYINEVKKQGGIGFIAHPDESKTRKNPHEPLRWTNWDIKGFDGIELWNYLSDWTDNMAESNLYLDYLFRMKKLSGPTEKTKKWWDELNIDNPDKIIPAIGGVDAHSFIYNICGISIKVFDYIDSFKAVLNEIYLDNKLSDSFDEAKKQILNSLKLGKNTIINKHWNKKNKNFEFSIQNTNKKAHPGDFIKLDSETTLSINLAREANIKLIYNGELILEKFAKDYTLKDLKPGKYRLEVFYKEYPWIFTNPIIVQ